ncbi:MAG: hypothetical protein QOI22_457 [Verrucomicrobiota bacterium]
MNFFNTRQYYSPPGGCQRILTGKRQVFHRLSSTLNSLLTEFWLFRAKKLRPIGGARQVRLVKKSAFARRGDVRPDSPESFRGWARQDSNLGPRDYESPALTAELQAHVLRIEA